MIVKLSFPAGKMLVDNLKVKPDLRKGKIQLTVDDSECSHFQWLAEGSEVEDDFIIFPGEFSFTKVVQSKSRVYLLEFQGERYFYWMQGPDVSKDSEICDQVNKILMPKPQEPKIDTSGLAKILESFAKVQKIPDIEEILNPDALKALAGELENDQELIDLLPEEQRNKEKMRENLLSPQLQHAMQVLSEAIRSPGGSAIFASVGLQDNQSLNIDPLERFLRALQAQADLRANFNMGSNCCKSARVHTSNLIPNIPDRSMELSRSDFDFSSVQKTHPWRRGNLIGEGSCGKVYQAMNDDTGQLLAVKVVKLDSNPSTADKQFTSLSQEISILRSLRHVNIVKYIHTDVFVEKREVNILLEYVTGGSLRNLLEKYGGLSAKVIKNYGYQIIRGLNYLHSHNVVHRDLKSANVLVTDDAVVKLTDFGCSKKCSDGELIKSVKGSPYWIAPEVLFQEGYGLSSDVWSFGCLLIEMATGRPPWSEYSDRATDVIKLIMTKGKLPKIPTEPKDFAELITACLSRNPEERPTADQIMKSHYFLTHSADCSQSFLSKDSSFTWYESKS